MSVNETRWLFFEVIFIKCIAEPLYRNYIGMDILGMGIHYILGIGIHYIGMDSRILLWATFVFRKILFWGLLNKNWYLVQNAESWKFLKRMPFNAWKVSKWSLSVCENLRENVSLLHARGTRASWILLLQATCSLAHTLSCVSFSFLPNKARSIHLEWITGCQKKE